MQSKFPMNFEELIASFEKLSTLESSSVQGGEVDLDLLFGQVFDFTASNLNPQAISMFKKEVTDLGQTELGENLLNALITAGKKIYVNNDALGGQGAYNFSHNQLAIGSLDPDVNSSWANGVAFTTIAHELYHAYQDIVIDKDVQTLQSKAYEADGKTEIDASLFSFMVTVQYDINHNLSLQDDNSRSRYASHMDDRGKNTPEATAFADAWDNILLNGQFTKENYNTLISNMSLGSTYTAQKQSFQTVSSLDETQIDNIFSGSYASYAKLYKQMLETNNLSTKPYDLVKTDPTLSPWQGYGGTGNTNESDNGGGEYGSSYPSGNGNSGGGGGFGNSGYGSGGYGGGNSGGNQSNPPYTPPQSPPNRDTYNNGPGGGTVPYGGWGYPPPNYYESNDSSSW
jgi:hypothetical protein